ncbi:hypothetical protein J2847_004885 [Azospirillum agricola]|uniref:SGNH/GDSL hydrolase family protein n=1 Tax=Azospirillum agricola TaxID=1720247 RepID=UPI001AE816CB|nr:SGNH/GDSL hydrolase family protein [Azospirillum agricola]MBP2231566.1 hypothetical protein [Azospirillum agricola]
MRRRAGRRLPLLAAALLMGMSAGAGSQTLAGSVWAESLVDEACRVPDSVLTTVDAGLPRVRERIDSGLPLSVLIVNSVKPSTRPPASGYPVWLKGELKRRLPGRRIEVEVMNLPGAAAPAMLEPLLRAVGERQPALVVWQTGTVDAMRNLDPESFGGALNRGIDGVVRQGADLVIMDMQYSMHTAQLIDFAPYLSYMAWLSQNAEVFHFPRYDIMRHWVETGRVDFGEADVQAKQDAYEFVHRCVGQLLAESIVSMIDHARRAAH